MLRSSPSDELLSRVNLLGASWNGQSPSPEPVGALAKALVRSNRKSDLVGHFRSLRVDHKGRSSCSVNPHAAFARLEKSKIFREAVAGSALRTCILHHLQIGVEGVFPFLGIELWLPLFVKPASAEGIRHGADKGHVFTPARLTAQTNTVHAIGTVRHFSSRRDDLVPSRGVRHLQSGLFHQVLAVHDKRALAVERSSIEFAIGRQTAGNGRQNVLRII